jgi:TonB-dependent receptor
LYFPVIEPEFGASMRKNFYPAAFILLFLSTLNIAFGQSSKGIINGEVKDAKSFALPGAKVTFEPQIQPVVSDPQGNFTITGVTPGTYTATISYVGFAPFVGSINVVAGQTAHIDAILKVANASEEVIVTAERPRGEAEAINRTRAAENILQVLPAEVITSLPNANIADALGRMPSVTIERDEGEGKYVQIRGTEPRLSNTMVDGVTIPSPESGVRQIKLDTIASDLVDSVEINKTLQANIDADGIGGSVNLVTKTAADTPTIAVYGVGGYTHIIGGRTVSQFGTTIGRRFLTDKKLGVLIGGTYDFNGRGINDIEPVPTATSAVPHYDSMDFRDYVYYRTRYGVTGSADYKLNEGSSVSLRGLFSTFRNWGNKWAFTMNDRSSPQYSQDWRRPNLAIGSVALQGNHLFNVSTIKWNLSVSRSRSLGGSGGANYSWLPDDGNKTDCVNDQSVAPSVYRPGWSSTGCGTMGFTGPENVFDKNNYGLNEYDLPTFGQSVQLNLQASASYSRLYHVGSRFGTFEFGGKIRNAHKFDDTYNSYYTYDTPEPIANHPEWNGAFSDPVYYDGSYGKYPATTDWVKVGNWANANQGTFNGGPGVNSNNYDLIERIPAGYLMNTIELASRVRLVAGLRFEATHVNTLSFDGGATPTPTTLTYKAGGDYLDVLPSASLRFALDKDSDLRLVYGRGLSRPDPQDITAAVSQPVLNQTPVTISLGNPNLKAEHANNYDVLYERFLNPLGLIQAGYFYKDLSDPIITTQFYSTQSFPHVPAGTNVLVTQPINAGSAHVQGVELGFQQRLSYLSGVLGGAGISANYSYTQSSTSGITENAQNADGTSVIRPDSPALLRQAPNTWNISPTYDTKHFSMRVGMTFDDRMIYAYQWSGTASQVNDPALGVKGPSGDNYLYSHFQFDTQATYNLPMGFQVYAYGLNLNNEVFGFFNGSEKYVVQREYYHPTYAGGIRWNLTREK